MNLDRLLHKLRRNEKITREEFMWLKREFSIEKIEKLLINKKLPQQQKKDLHRVLTALRYKSDAKSTTSFGYIGSSPSKITAPIITAGGINSTGKKK